MRRLLIVGLGIIVLALAGCGEATADTTTSSASPVVTEAGVATSAPSTTTTTAPTTTATAKPTTTTTAEATTTTLSDFYQTYSGSGNKIVDLGTSPGGVSFILHLVSDGDIDIETFNSTGEDTRDADFSIPHKGAAYDGRVMAGSDTTKLQINAEGNWTVEVQPLSAARLLEPPGTAEGFFDEVIRLTGSPSSLEITGNPNDEFENLIVRYHETGDDYGDSLVNELSRYEGLLVVPGDGYLTVIAGAPWSVTAQD